MDGTVFELARQSRDPRFDGRFFVGVITTGVYCRPICPVRIPKAPNVRFFESAAAAAEAGFRPCLRCRPEAAPGTPAWQGTSTTVARGLRLIQQGELDEGSVESLSLRLGVTSRHLRRLFLEHLGAAPTAVAQTRRLHFAKRLIDETAMPMNEIALAAGYGSVRRFNDHFRAVYDRPPSSLRKSRPGTSDLASLQLKLPFRPPFDFDALIEFLRVRATPGVEMVDVESGSWSRSVRLGDDCGWIQVTRGDDERCIDCEIRMPSSRGLMLAVERIRWVFDLNADPREIDGVLGRDPDLAPLIKANPGGRIPGAWDPFEVAVRAVVGQQVSVKGATTIMGRLADAYGETVDGRLHFPVPDSLAELDPATLPMPRRRAEALKQLAGQIAAGELDLRAQGPESLEQQLVRIPGIGPWTAQYIAMRAIGDPDAFLAGDLVLRRVAGEYLGIDSERALVARAERWRPWRAYAGVHLWAIAGKIKETRTS